MLAEGGNLGAGITSLLNCESFICMSIALSDASYHFSFVGSFQRTASYEVLYLLGIEILASFYKIDSPCPHVFQSGKFHKLFYVGELSRCNVVLPEIS